MDIKWEDGAVCFAGGEQWSLNDGISDVLFNNLGTYHSFDELLSASDFQLNTIKQGDYIEASDLDTEQKYNDAVEVFGLFGFKRRFNYGTLVMCDFCYASNNGHVAGCSERHLLSIESRKLTYPQLMAIGKLKRGMVERDKSTVCGEPKSDFIEAAKRVNELEGFVSSNKYEREITDRQGNSAIVDVYDVLKAFNVTCPATQHALKKLLCSGIRGHKDLQTDLLEAKESITRAIELND